MAFPCASGSGPTPLSRAVDGLMNLANGLLEATGQLRLTAARISESLDLSTEAFDGTRPSSNAGRRACS